MNPSPLISGTRLTSECCDWSNVVKQAHLTVMAKGTFSQFHLATHLRVSERRWLVGPALAQPILTGRMLYLTYDSSIRSNY